jgi:antitoxin (DNA-binding transcriptional repressor) of toxin-antitoxin stability system
LDVSPEADSVRYASESGRGQKHLPELIKAVEGGASVTICRRGVPVVDIVRADVPTGTRRKFGTLKGRIQILDPDWWKPMTDAEVENWIVGRY